MYVVTSCWMNVKRRSEKRCAMLSGEPVRRLSMQMTSSPSARKRSQRCDPMKPAPPVMRMRAIDVVPVSARGRGGAADRQVGEAVLAHDLGLVEVPAVEDDGPPEEPLHAREVGTAELVPLRDDEQGVGVLERLVVGPVVRHAVAEVRARLGERLRVVDRELRAAREEALDDGDGRGLAHVVGAGLEGEAPDREAPAVQVLPELRRDLLD